MTRPLRILVGNWSARRVGGAETYIEAAVAGLRAAGHAVGCLFETDGDPSRPPIQIPDGVPVWQGDVAAAASWRPDVVYAHGFLDSAFEANVQRLAPCVLFAHNYYGTCISGNKAFSRPSAVACTRRFGPTCLALYLPRGCGGRNPLAMVRQYDTQRRRFRLLDGYRSILTASKHMATEFRRHVRAPDRVRLVRLPFLPPANAPPNDIETRVAEYAAGRPARLLFVGRLEPTKGPMVAADSAGRIARAIGRPVELTFVGDGTERDELERRSADFAPATLRFAGWLSGAALSAEFARSDLLLMSSVWPEPFGLVGLEVGWHGVPATGFDHGGIPDWLHDNESGVLAPAEPATAVGLAAAAIRCLRSADELLRLSRGARAVAASWPGTETHLVHLTDAFDELLRNAVCGFS